MSVAVLPHGRVELAVTGDRLAPPLLLNRPLGGSMALWGDFAKRLAQAFQVVTFDPLGVGRSSDAPWLYSTRAMARDSVAVLDHLGITRAHVFGLSLGGMAASWMALDHPERVHRLVLASTLPEPTAISARGLRQTVSMLRCFAGSANEVELAFVHRILSPEFRSRHPERLQAIERAVREVPARRKNLATLALAAARHHAPLQRLSPAIQTLLLFGERDLLAGEKAQSELVRELPTAKLEIVKASGHDITLEQPRDSADRVIRFLRTEH